MNDVKVLTDQPLVLLLAVSLLEPSGEGSFFYWGFSIERSVQAEYEKITLWFPSLMLLEEYPEVSDSWNCKVLNPDYADDTSGVIDFSSARRRSPTLKPTHPVG
jgi:hypothetical protein